MFKDFREQMKGPGIKLCHINVRGLQSKLTEVTLLVQESKLDILVVTESHLDKSISDDTIKIEGYAVQRCDSDKNCGGCLIYYGEHLDITVKNDIDKRSTETVWMDLLIDSQHHLTAEINRLPNRADIYDRLKDTLDEIWIKRKNIVCLMISILTYYLQESYLSKYTMESTYSK